MIPKRVKYNPARLNILELAAIDPMTADDWLAPLPEQNLGGHIWNATYSNFPITGSYSIR